MGSSIKDKLTGNCESCAERQRKIREEWRKWKEKVNAAFEARKKK